MKRRRVVVTGLGVVSCFGNDVDEFYECLLAGKSGIAPISSFPCESYPTRFAGAIRQFDPGEYIDKKNARRIDPFISYAIVAGKKALEMGGLGVQKSLDQLDKSQCGVLVGSGMGGLTIMTGAAQVLAGVGNKRMSPFFIPYSITNMASALLACDVGFMGPNYSISTACATGNHCIMAAAGHIQQGDADLMLCGGVEAPISPMGVSGFSACKALSQRNDAPEKASRPWDKDRDGFVMGEGSGVLLLEELGHAQQRGAPILAEYLGGGMSSDAYHMTEPRPDGEGVAQCIHKALVHAGVQPEQINYINAHATSTPLGDMAEVNALKKVFPQRRHIAMNATKSMIGHLLGGAGGIEAVVVVKAIVTQKIHPTINLENPEEELDFFVPTQAVSQEIEVAISNSFGFGGHNATIVFAPFKP